MEIKYARQVGGTDAVHQINQPHDSRERKAARGFFSGRTASLRILAACTAAVFAVNIAVLAYAKSRGSSGDGDLTLFRGGCSQTKSLNVALHAALNVLAIVVSASVSAFLASLSSPTRDEIDRAHAKGTWFEIGVPSVHNLTRIGTLRAWLCALLFLSTLPIQILYNSVIYQSIGSTRFYWLLATPDFVASTDYSIYNLPPSPLSPGADPAPRYLRKITQMHSDAQSRYVQLSALDCLRVYSNLYPSEYSDVIMITSDKNDTNPLLAWDFSTGGSWRCSEPNDDLFSPERYCDFKALERNVSSWSTFGHPIQYCLADPLVSLCELALDRSLIIGVIVLNAILLAVMLISLTGIWSTVGKTLGCWGDVVRLYLEREDQYSHGLCLADCARIHRAHLTHNTPLTPSSRTRRWHQALSRPRKIALIVCLACGLLSCLACLAYTLYIIRNDRHLSISPENLWRLGFGSNSQTSVLLVNELDLDMTSVAVKANIPQLFFAIITLVVNSAVVQMVMEAEYVQFATLAKTLRVSNPSSPQRGTYILSIPLRYAIPLQLLTATLHWCISQSIVPFRVVLTRTENPTMTDVSTDLGFSPLGIVCSVLVSCFLVAFITVLCFRKLPAPMPLGSSCSLVLAAAVHPAEAYREDAATQKLMWGVTGYGMHGVGHCSFAEADMLGRVDYSRQYI